MEENQNLSMDEPGVLCGDAGGCSLQSSASPHFETTAQALGRPVDTGGHRPPYNGGGSGLRRQSAVEIAD